MIEAAAVVNNQNLIIIGQRFVEVSIRWDNIAVDMWELSQSLDAQLLKKISSAILNLYNEEKELHSLLKEIVEEFNLSY